MIFQSYGIIIFSIFSSLCILQSILLVIYLQGIKLCPKTRSKIFRPVRPSFCIHTYMYFDLSLSKIWCKNWKQVERQATKKNLWKKIVVLIFSILIHLWSSRSEYRFVSHCTTYIPVVERNIFITYCLKK